MSPSSPSRRNDLRSGDVSSAIATIPEAGVVRVGVVYTPAERRHNGYAGALVAATSAWRSSTTAPIEFSTRSRQT